MSASVSRCLDEDEILAFARGDLRVDRRREVLAHVDTCETCRELAAIVAQEGPTDVEASGARHDTGRRKDRDGDEDGDGDEGDDDGGIPPSSDRAASITSGTLVDGRFLLLEALGRGAMGAVFRARDEKLGTEVALKALPRTKADNRAFARELVVGRKITDSHVCRLYDAGSTDRFDYITMELIDGHTLAQLLAKEELTTQRAVAILDDVAAGLAAVHEQGIVHRDLKPANVMLERGTGRAVVTDFGFATSLDAKQSRRLVGTPAYWSPEQARGESATPASDVYSFGVLAYRLLAQHDFRLSDADALEHVPRGLRRTVQRCVALRPAERFRDAREVRASLRAAGRIGQRVGAGRGRGWMAVVVLGVAGIVGWRVVAMRAGAEPGKREGAEADANANANASANANANANANASANEAAGAASTGVVANSAVADATSGAVVHQPLMRPTSVRGTATSPPPVPSASHAVSRPLPAPPASAAASAFTKPGDGDLLFRK